MRLLIGASSSKIFHLKEFAENLEKNNVECRVVFDSDFADGYPSCLLYTSPSPRD